MDADASASRTRVERLTARLRENPVVAILLVASAIVVGVASFTDSAAKLVALFTKQSPATARTALGQMALPFTASAFVASAEAGDLTAVKLFVTAGMDVNASSGDGSTALASAAFAGRLPVMTALLDAGARISDEGDQRSALYSAVVGGHDDALRLLLARKPDQDTIDAAFVVAVRRRFGASPRNVPALRTLAAAGANVRRVAPDAFRTAWENAYDDDAAEVVAVLLDLGAVLADLDGTNGETDRKTPLMDAASQDFPKTVALLLARGAALETRYRDPDHDDDGATALMMAADSGSATIVRALLAKGAKVDARDRRGLRAIDYAKSGGSLRVNAEVVGLLQQALR